VLQLAVDTLGHLLVLPVTHADEQAWARVSELAKTVQEVKGHSIELAFVDQDYTGNAPAQAAKEHGMKLEVVKLPEAKRGLRLTASGALGVERCFAWMTRFRRLSRDY
jgi:hypothetical protein